ncbi:zinc-ribbon domain-containing protein [Amycolatopsis anabasis]|uniref:zinc-ribbon domain-containing protein n=1 Tax=Amycolatopsis anabasis TaxID=1840409 RepID=UPI00131B9D2A|nr:zinc-ribbon domain-containing protein [Amycolatopsis anabasis]
MLIWGYRQKVLHLAMATFLCGTCGNPTAHALRRAVTKFTLFFIPLFPIHSKYFTQCTFCGATNRLTKDQAQQVLATAQPAQDQAAHQPAPQQPQPHPQYQHPHQP